MNWLNLNTAVLDSPEFLGGSPVERATWLCLLRYCVGQENGGRIVGCRSWKDRQWQQLVRVTWREVIASSDLWTWEGDDLVVAHYPSDKESEVKSKRTRAAENGKKGGRPNTQTGKTDNTETNVGFTEEPTPDNSAKAEGERKEKGKEGERKENVLLEKEPKARQRAVWVAPSLEEWTEYGKSLKPPYPEIELLSSHAHYESNGWKVGKSKAPCKDWKATLRTCWTRWRKEGMTPGGKLLADTPKSFVQSLHRAPEIPVAAPEDRPSADDFAAFKGVLKPGVEP